MILLQTSNNGSKGITLIYEHVLLCSLVACGHLRGYAYVWFFVCNLPNLPLELAATPQLDITPKLTKLLFIYVILCDTWGCQKQNFCNKSFVIYFDQIFL